MIERLRRAAAWARRYFGCGFKQPTAAEVAERDAWWTQHEARFADAAANREFQLISRRARARATEDMARACGVPTQSELMARLDRRATERQS